MMKRLVPVAALLLLLSLSAVPALAQFDASSVLTVTGGCVYGGIEDGDLVVECVVSWVDLDGEFFRVNDLVVGVLMGGVIPADGYRASVSPGATEGRERLSFVVPRELTFETLTVAWSAVGVARRHGIIQAAFGSGLFGELSPPDVVVALSAGDSGPPEPPEPPDWALEGGMVSAVLLLGVVAAVGVRVVCRRRR